MLEVDNVSVNYGPVRAVHSVSLSVNEGEIVALLGPNGAGKTSMLSAIIGLVPVAEGTETDLRGPEYQPAGHGEAGSRAA